VTVAVGALTLAPVPLLFSGDFLYYAIAFFALAIVVGLAGMSGIAGLSMSIARVLIVVFIVLALISLIL
jgi:uncharacterized membrane protein YtjA (UPF0391 family)